MSHHSRTKRDILITSAIVKAILAGVDSVRQRTGLGDFTHICFGLSRPHSLGVRLVGLILTHATFRSWCEACVAGRATKDSHRRSATGPSVPLVAMDDDFLGRDTDVELATILVLIQRPHGAVGACQVLRKSPERYAIDCALAYLDTADDSYSIAKPSLST